MSAPYRPEPITWPSSLYELASLEGSGRYGELLATCAMHHGEHVVHGSARTGWWCQSLPPHRRRPGMERALARLRNRRDGEG